MSIPINNSSGRVFVMSVIARPRKQKEECRRAVGRGARTTASGASINERGAAGARLKDFPSHRVSGFEVYLGTKYAQYRYRLKSEHFKC